MANTYTLIASNTLSSSAASVTFSSIPSTYTDLVLRFSARSTRATFVFDLCVITMNGVGGTSYSDTVLQGDGSTATSTGGSSAASTYAPRYSLTAAGATANTFGSSELYIPNYTGSVNKPFYGFGVTETNATAAYMTMGAQMARISSAITSITLTPSAGPNFDIGSSFYLYGIKNS